MIPYFVSYATRDGFGNLEVNLPLPVRTFADVKALADCASKSVGKPVAILNYRRVADEQAEPATT